MSKAHKGPKGAYVSHADSQRGGKVRRARRHDRRHRKAERLLVRALKGKA